MKRLLLTACAAALSVAAFGAHAQTAAPAAAPFTDANDPYLWLENVSSPEAMKWVNDENAKTLSVLTADPRYAKNEAAALAIGEAKDRIPYAGYIGRDLYNYWQDADHVRGYWRRTTETEYRKDAPAWATVLDLDALAKAENANWVWKGATCERPGDRLCLVSLSDGGEDAVTIREFDLKTSSFVKSGFELPKGKQRVAWQDENTLLVARDWGSGTMTPSGYPFIIKAVKRGQPMSAAVEVFRGAADDGGYGVSAFVLHDAQGHKATFFFRPLTTFESETYIQTAKGPQKLGIPAKASVSDLLAGRLLISLDQDWTDAQGTKFSQGSLVSTPLAAAMADPAHLTGSLVYKPGPRDSLQGVSTTANTLVLLTLENVRGRAYVYTPAKAGGWSHRKLGLPDNVSVGLTAASNVDDRLMVNITGFTEPSTLWAGTATAGELTRIKALPPKFDASNQVVEQFEATSTDGEKIPYFIVHRKDVKLDGSTPTILGAYGGFQVSQMPSYSATIGKLWLEKGGAYVLANIRGGGEFGPAWHEAGLKTKRQIVYDDFAAVGQDLITRGFTTPRRLGIRGGSNGGLLMGVEFEQHPDLWNAVSIEVPLLDMLRIEKIAAGASWVGEYGSVSVPAERAFWERLSPYHNLKAGVKYPEPFIFTTTKDDRVGPQHARKFAARMKAMGLPYLFYENTEGGHAAGANIKQTARTSALTYTYFQEKLMD